MTELRTPRLWLRPFQEDDIPAYQAIRSNPNVTRYLPSHTKDPAEARARAAATVRAFMTCWAEDGYGPWAVLVEGRLAGHLGLRWLPELGETEVLFLIDPDMQGRGLASEGAGAALAWGFDTLGLPRIVAYAMPANAASIATLERIGMMRQPGQVQVFGIDALRFVLDAP